ncbi:MAG: glycosyltransferase [Thermoguttaceae bacterium]|nr:glycosyltransferase [Thermoguttaceae bacterium]
MDPKVSLIIPVFNAEKYLAQCLDSAIRQTLRELEIICIDDGSTDSSAEILKQYAVRDSRIRVIHQENGGPGPSAARNRGLDAAHGEFIAFMDADDWCEPEMCETAYSLAVQHNAEIAQFNFYRIKNNIIKPWKKCPKGPRIFTTLRERYETVEMLSGAVWVRLYKKSLLDQWHIRFPEKMVFEDNYFALFAALRAERITHIGDILYNYRQGCGLTSNSDSSFVRITAIDTWDRILKEARCMSLPGEIIEDLEKKKLRIFYKAVRRMAYDAVSQQKARNRVLELMTEEDWDFVQNSPECPLKYRLFFKWLLGKKFDLRVFFWLGKCP